MAVQGLRPHTHAERGRIIQELIPLFRRKFGENLLAVAAEASYARGDDGPYSDLELLVFVREGARARDEKGEEKYLQRIFDGMLVEAMYVTPEEFLDARRELSPDWFLLGAETLLPVYNEAFIEALVEQCRAIRYPRERFVARAAARFHEVQESFGKVLTAIERGDAEAVSLLLYDAVLHSLITLSFLNEKPFTTFAAFVREARGFHLKPARLEELLGIVSAGDYRDLNRLKQVVLAFFEGFERLFAAEGVSLYDESLDPNLPNKRWD